jgi:hypothetical protein
MDAIRRSGLVLVIDEAHYLISERVQKGRPRMIDFIDADLCNHGVSVALVSTPQFGFQLAQFETHTKWNARQFKRRFSARWCQIEGGTTADHLLALAKKFLPDVGEKGIKVAAKYAEAFTRDAIELPGRHEKISVDVSGLFDLVRDAQRRARKAGRNEPNFQDLRDAYEKDRLPTENAMAAAFTIPRVTKAAPAGRGAALALRPSGRITAPAPVPAGRAESLTLQPLEPAQ